jgi:hypothetical protein
VGFFGPSREERDRELTINYTRAKDEEFRKVQALLERLQEEWAQPGTHHCYLDERSYRDDYRGVGATVTWEGSKLRIRVWAGCWNSGHPIHGRDGEPLDGQHDCSVTVKMENTVAGTDPSIFEWRCESYISGVTEPKKYFDWIARFLFNSPPMVAARLETERVAELKRKLGV